MTLFTTPLTAVATALNEAIKKFTHGRHSFSIYYSSPSSFLFPFHSKTLPMITRFCPIFTGIPITYLMPMCTMGTILIVSLLVIKRGYRFRSLFFSIEPHNPPSADAITFRKCYAQVCLSLFQYIC